MADPGSSFEEGDFEELVGGDVVFLYDGSVLQTHGSSECSAPCPIHAPSNHHMVSWPQLWRDDSKIMERRCPHGIGHPDPDDRRVRSRTGYGIHGCDGCCWWAAGD